MTEKEFNCLINKKCKTSNFKISKFHISDRLKKIIEETNSNHINIIEKLNIEGHVIVAGPVYNASQISEIFHIML